MSVVVEQLTVRYGALTAVDGVSFTAPAGAVTAILGPNGAGKTSTIEVCEGFRSAARGRVTVLGLDPVRDRARLAPRMGVMLQGGGVWPSARVADVVMHFCALYGRGVRADDLIERLGLGHRSRASWRSLSGGEQQRVSLALALAADPEVVFLDEPTSGIDIEGRDVVARIVRELADRGTTVLLATHEMAEAERTADHAVLFRAGRVVVAGPVGGLREPRDTLRFATDVVPDIAGLAAALGCGVAPRGEHRYEAALAPTAAHIALLTGWLADNGIGLVSLETGQESLEDAYRRLTGGAA
ncbi:MAG: hypothetical protein RL330_1481 [Actinomycetota bacterium]|jgi:ABC-2 type transport system ATP-binding protein